MTLRSSDLQSDSDSIRNSCDVSFVTWRISLLIGMAMTEGGGQNGDNMLIWGVGLS